MRIRMWLLADETLMVLTDWRSEARPVKVFVFDRGDLKITDVRVTTATPALFHEGNQEGRYLGETGSVSLLMQKPVKGVKSGKKSWYWGQLDG